LPSLEVVAMDSTLSLEAVAAVAAVSRLFLPL
jgi:hypothetical protein